MTFLEYQQEAHETSQNTKIGNDTLAYAVLGLSGEAGEVANKVKKIYRDGKGKISPEAKAALVKELGDVLWYIAEIATQLGLNLDGIAAVNLTELRGRALRGSINGSGDER